jgi:O-antigen ligase
VYRRRVRIRRRPTAAAVGRAVAGAAVAATVAVVGLASGGYFPHTWRLTALALGALAAAAVLARRRIVVSRLEWLFLAGFAALTLWTALSTFWSENAVTSGREAERTGLYVVGAAAILLAVDRRSLAWLLGGAIAGITAVAAYGLGQYVIGGHPLNPIEGNLLFEPVGYANAFGILCAIGVALSVGMALAPAGRFARLAALAGLPILVPTLYLTSSRGAWLALAAGLAAIFGLGQRFSARAKVVVLVAALFAVVAVTAISGEHGIAAHLVGQNRPYYWRVAWKEYRLNPLLGSGAGTFDSYWLHYRPIDSFARDAHSLYVETLAELGPLGLALVLVALATPFAGVRRRLEPLTAAAAGGYVAFVVHLAVDWDWELPAVTLTGVTCGAALLVGTRREARRPLSRRTRAALVLTALAAAGVSAARLKGVPSLPFGG